MLTSVLRSGRARAAIGWGRRVCTAAQKEPLLPKWGSFGRSAEDIATMEERVRIDGERQVAVTRAIAELGLRFQTMVTKPLSWMDAEFRSGWMDNVSEPLDRYSRIQESMLDGCEAAYHAVASEFHRENPEFALFVESGAIEPELAKLLGESLEKYAAAGRRPVLQQGRVNGQVLLVDMQGDSIVATVVFRTRELQSTAHIGTPTGATGAREETPSTDYASDGGAVSGEVEGEAATGADASSPEASADDSAFSDGIQLWTFAAQQPPIGQYLQWLRSKVESGGGQSGAEVEVPVQWQLRDINFVVQDYEPPLGATVEPAEAVDEFVQKSMLFFVLVGLLCVTVARAATRPTRPPSSLPLRSQDDGGGSWSTARARRPHEHSNGPQALNQYGDALTSASHNADDTNGGGTREF